VINSSFGDDLLVFLRNVDSESTIKFVLGLIDRGGDDHEILLQREQEGLVLPLGFGTGVLLFDFHLGQFLGLLHVRNIEQ